MLCIKVFISRPVKFSQQLCLKCGHISGHAEIIMLKTEQRPIHYNHFSPPQ